MKSSQEKNKAQQLSILFEPITTLQRSASIPSEEQEKNKHAPKQRAESFDEIASQLSEMNITHDNHLSNISEEFTFFKPIRNQPSYSVDHRLSDKMEKLLKEKQLHMGKLERTSQPGVGIGGGILISESHMLVPKHCFDNQNMENFNIIFEYLNSNMYKIKRVLSDIEAKDFGLHAGPNSDLMVLELKHGAHGYPGQNGNYTSLKTPTNKTPAMLHFMGYTSGKTLKVSTMPGRPIEVPQIVKRGEVIAGQHAFWNDFGTHGDIIEHNQAPFTTVKIQSLSGPRQFYVIDNEVYREDGTLANKINEFYVLYPNIFGVDHVRLAHRTKFGSSGGIYFNENGEIFAVHCGRLPSEKYYPEHIAFYPWTLTTTTIYDDQLIYETKTITLASMIKSHLKDFKPNQYIFNLNEVPVGYITEVIKVTDGRQFIVKPFEQNGTPFSFVIPYTPNRDPIYVNGTNYEKRQLTFNFSTRATQETILPPPPALYRVPLKSLIEGNALSELPVMEQIELGVRIRNNRHVSHSMTSNDLHFKHTTLGNAQQQGAHYEFVYEECEDNDNPTIAIHAIGCHRSNSSYKISQYSQTFEKCAKDQGLWISPNQHNQPQPIFRL